MKQIVFYRTPAGACPIEAFLDSLPARQAQKVAWVLQLIEEIDIIPGQYFKKITGTSDVWEVRVESGGDAFRLLGFLQGAKFVILTHAFRKKTQKTPLSDIRLAEQRRTDYLRRMHKK